MSCTGKSTGKSTSNSYTPKKATANSASRRTSGGNPFAMKSNSFGVPSVKMSFSGKNRSK